MNSGCLKLYRSVSVVLSSIYKKQSWTILNWSWSKVVPLALLLNTFLRIPSQIIPSHNSPALSFGAPPRLFSEPLPVWYQFSIIPNNSRSCVCDIAVVTGPRSEVVSERKRHSKPRVQSVPADWRMSAVVDTHAHSRVYEYACTRIAYERRHETSTAWRAVARDPSTGESLDARRAARMEWRNGTEWKLAPVYLSLLV